MKTTKKKRRSRLAAFAALVHETLNHAMGPLAPADAAARAVNEATEARLAWLRVPDGPKYDRERAAAKARVARADAAAEQAVERVRR